MGFALPAAIGAKDGSPGSREVVAVIGDGGYQMTIQELGTIFQQQVAVKIVMLNNDFSGNGTSVAAACFLTNVMPLQKWQIQILLTIAKGYSNSSKPIE